MEDSIDFDTDLIIHINSAIGKLNQNGVGNFLIVKDDTSTWNDLIEPLKSESNQALQMIPLFVALSTKLLFDPPPPSSVELHSKSADELLWRLKIAHES